MGIDLIGSIASTQGQRQISKNEGIVIELFKSIESN